MITTVRDPAQALTTDPIAAHSNRPINRERRPYMSPRRPHTAADVAATRANAVSVQLASTAVTSNVPIILGSALNIIVDSNALTTSARMSIPMISGTGRWGRGVRATSLGDITVLSLGRAGLNSHGSVPLTVTAGIRFRHREDR